MERSILHDVLERFGIRIQELKTIIDQFFKIILKNSRTPDNFFRRFKFFNDMEHSDMECY